MSTLDNDTSTQNDGYSGRELSGTLTPSTGTSQSHKLLEADFGRGATIENLEKRPPVVEDLRTGPPLENLEKGPPVEGDNAQMVCSKY
jgi:hypothetical protein